MPPPGAGLNTVIDMVAALAILAAGTDAVNWVLLTYVVGSTDPFQLMTELPIKPLPVTVKLKAAPPAVVFAGDNEVKIGNGLLELLMMKLKVLLIPPPGAGLKTVMDAVPAAAIFAAGTMAEICVVLI